MKAIRPFHSDIRQLMGETMKKIAFLGLVLSLCSACGDSATSDGQVNETVERLELAIRRPICGIFFDCGTTALEVAALKAARNVNILDPLVRREVERCHQRTRCRDLCPVSHSIGYEVDGDVLVPYRIRVNRESSTFIFCCRPSDRQCLLKRLPD